MVSSVCQPLVSWGPICVLCPGDVVCLSAAGHELCFISDGAFPPERGTRYLKARGNTGMVNQERPGREPQEEAQPPVPESQMCFTPFVCMVKRGPSAWLPWVRLHLSVCFWFPRMQITLLSKACPAQIYELSFGLHRLLSFWVDSALTTFP